MNKCISCSCTGYKSPVQQKNTLLQLKHHCQDCGHQASEHRKLTAVDQFIKSEVAKGRRSRCHASIFPSEIPMSPVFGRYDLIPLPRDDPSCGPITENSVECTCKGFRIPDVIRLCQKFRTFKLSDASVELREVLCTFCNHPLLAHAAPDGNGGSNNSSEIGTQKPALGVYDSLTLTSSSSLPFPPINSDCLELMLPANYGDAFTLLTVGKFQDSEILMLAIAHQTLSRLVEERSAVETMGKDSCGDDLVTASKKKVRGKEASATSKRRSKRVASKKAKQEQDKVLKQLKGLKGTSRAPVVGMDVGGMVEEMEQVEYTEMEYRQVLETTTELIRKIDARDNYHLCYLPQELLLDEHPVMASLRISQSTITAQEAEEGGQEPMETNQSMAPSRIMVAMGAKEGLDVFVAVLPAEEGKEGTLVLNWHRIRCPGEGALACLLLWEAVLEEGVRGMVAAGMNSGVVCVWKACFAGGRVKDMSIVATFNCVSQCVTMSCSPDSKLLVAGTVLGEAVFCPLTFDEEPSDSSVHRFQCCNAPIQCITWSHDGRLVAVGSCDDTIQVLQCVTPHKAQQTHSGSLFNYCHTSFVADLRFVQDYFLASLGWDGQLLFWRLRPLPEPDQLGKGRPHRSKVKSEVQPEQMDPVGGYKLGPSQVVEFLPLLLQSAVGCGLVVAMANKLGGVTMAGYAKPSYGTSE